MIPKYDLRNILVDGALEMLAKFDKREFDHPAQREAALQVAIGEFALGAVMADRGNERGMYGNALRQKYLKMQAEIADLKIWGAAMEDGLESLVNDVQNLDNELSKTPSNITAPPCFSVEAWAAWRKLLAGVAIVHDSSVDVTAVYMPE